MINLTNGWDTAFVLRASEVNKAIKRAGATPKEFRYQAGDDSFTVKGTFGDWTIAPGGSGKLINLSVPATDLLFEVSEKQPDGSLKNKPLAPVKELTALVQVELDFFERESASDRPKEADLKVKTNADKPVSLLDLQSPDADTLEKAISREAFEGFFNQNPEIFNGILTTINLDEVSSDAAFAWMKPSSVSYAYVEKIDANGAYLPDSGLLGVLCMTQGRSFEGLNAQISAEAVPDGQTSAFLIGKRLFLEQLLLPGVYQAFGFSYPSTMPVFELYDEGIRLSRGCSFKKSMKDQEGDMHDVSILVFDLRLEEDHISIYSETMEDVGDWQFVHTRSNHLYKLNLYDVKNGKSFGYQEDGSPSVQHWVEDRKPWYMKAIEIAAIVIGIAAAIAITILTEGIGMFIGLAIVGLITGLVMMQDEIWGAINKDEAPDMGTWLSQVNQVLVWPNKGAFAVSGLHLLGGLQLYGHF